MSLICRYRRCWRLEFGVEWIGWTNSPALEDFHASFVYIQSLPFFDPFLLFDRSLFLFNDETASLRDLQVNCRPSRYLNCSSWSEQHHFDGLHLVRGLLSLCSESELSRLNCVHCPIEHTWKPFPNCFDWANWFGEETGSKRCQLLSVF